MTDAPDMQLVEEFAKNHSEAAFKLLVQRHIGLVHSVALRHTMHPQHAEDITQAVFIILARKASSLGRNTIIPGWLYHTARLTAANSQRAEASRIRREQEAFMQTLTEEDSSDIAWQKISPLIDEAMSHLGATDRDALVLRYFQNKTLREVGGALGVGSDAAQKRVNRALEKLRTRLVKQGVTLGAAVLAGAVTVNSVQAAPAGLATTIAATAAKGMTITATITTLVKGTMKLMAWAKVKMAVGVSVAVIVAGSAVTFALASKPASKPNEQQFVPPTGNHVGTTFFSMLEKTPIVAKAVFEKELFMNNVPAGARDQMFTFRSDGDNYLLSTEGINVGKFGGVSWQAQNGYLTMFDPKINKPDGPRGGILGEESVTKMTVDLFLTLGIKDILPGTAVWEPGNTGFRAKTRDGKDLIVETLLTNGVPVIAYALTEDGQRNIEIDFKYSPGFYGGQVPIEFTAYWMKRDTKNGETKGQAMYDIRVKALEISDDKLDESLLNPTEMNPRSKTFFYSNNILYGTDAKGNVSKILTTEENNAEIQKLQNNK